jgi:hypothetical protein
MEPISLILGSVGLAASLFGGISSANTARQEAGVSEDIAQQEGAENAVRQDMQQTQGRRAQLETLRTTQRARASAIQAGATQTGSLTGSGVQGGIAETTSEGLFGLQGINYNLAYGTKLFGINQNITSDKLRMASLGGEQATNQGIASIGGALMQAGPTLGKISKGFGGGSNGMFFNGPWTVGS